MYDDEFYDEHSEFDQQVDELKASLMNSVKDEFKAEMDRLRAENAELQEFKQEKQRIEREIANMKRQSEGDKQEAIKQAKMSRLSELLGGFGVEMWTPEYYYIDSRKCDRCDENRRVHYKTPLGRDSYESCTCHSRISIYQPAKNTLHRLSTRSQWKEIQNVWHYYQIKTDGDYDSVEWKADGCAKNLFVPGVTTFEEVEKNQFSRVYFENYDDCKNYCVWKMEKDAGIFPHESVAIESNIPAAKPKS